MRWGGRQTAFNLSSSPINPLPVVVLWSLKGRCFKKLKGLITDNFLSSSPPKFSVVPVALNMQGGNAKLK